MRVRKPFHRGPTSSALGVFLLLAGSLFRPDAGAAEAETRQLVVEKIEIEGNAKTRPGVILQHLTVEPGQPIGPEDLLNGQSRLSKTRFFKQVDVYARPGS